jgi:hypothetical protein
VIIGLFENAALTFLILLTKLRVSTYNAIYLSLIALALLLAIKAYKSGVGKARFLVFVLSATLLVELYSTWAIPNKIAFGWAYHLFNPIEYTGFCLYFLATHYSQKPKFWVKYSIPIYIIASLSISFFVYHVGKVQNRNAMPALNINLEGLLLFIVYTYLLFSLDEDMPVYLTGDFWISVGVMSFFGGASIFLGLYSILFKINYEGTMGLFGLIARPLNIVLYCCIIIGLLCTIRNRKYSIA